MEINLNNKKFKALSNSSNGEVSDDTVFHYFQRDALVWAEYQGGGIVKGFLIGKVEENQLKFSYQHLNENLEIMTGKCTSSPESDANGKIKLIEKWEWTCKDFSKGESILIEIT